MAAASSAVTRSSASSDRIQSFVACAAAMGAGQDLRAVKREPEFAARREEILSMIWDMEEEIMGRAPGQAASA